MHTTELYKLKYPIGEFNKPKQISEQNIDAWVTDIEKFPISLENIISELSDEELDYVYRPKGWTIRQVVHHCADSHINSIIRFKLALTENTPTIRPYFEDRWAHLIDYKESLEAPLKILKGVHNKLSVLLRQLNKDELKREFIHPEHNKRFSLEETIGVYAWHSNHHLAHIKQALKHKGNF